MAMIDIFNEDAFRTVTLTDAIEKMDYQPSLLRDMGIFEKQPVRTTTVALEKTANGIGLIPVSERGAPIDQNGKEKRDIRHTNTIRLAKGDVITADELQNIRAFGSETELKAVQTEVAARISKIEADMELTEENMMLGAIQGIVVDADGSTVVHNWFTFWGVSQPAEIDFDLDNATPARGALAKACKSVIRTMQTAAKGAFTPQTEVVGLCGDAFFDDLVAHPEVTGNLNNALQAQALANEYGAYSSIRFGNITWINYRGTDDGSTVAVGTDKVKFFPKNARGVFKHALAPAEFMPYVNTLGKERYAMVLPDTKRQAFTEVELYTYPLFYCTRPEVLLRGKRT
jgi:hypothetical protein